MRASVVYLLCILPSVVGFIPVAPICGGAGPRVGSLVVPIRSSSCSSSTKLSMGFDFKDMMEKMSDTRYARVRHILVDDKGKEGRARLEEVKEAIGGDLEKFSAEAERISTCTSASRGGRLKLLARGETVPEFDEVAFKGELGMVHGPIETSFGTHLIWIESCNKPQNTWKMLFDDVVKSIKGDGGEEA